MTSTPTHSGLADLNDPANQRSQCACMQCIKLGWQIAQDELVQGEKAARCFFWRSPSILSVLKET